MYFFLFLKQLNFRKPNIRKKLNWSLELSWFVPILRKDVLVSQFKDLAF